MMELQLLSNYVSQELRCGWQRGEYLSLVMSNLFVQSLSNHIGRGSTEGHFLLLQPEAWTKQALDPPLAARSQAYEDVMLAPRVIHRQGYFEKELSVTYTPKRALDFFCLGL